MSDAPVFLGPLERVVARGRDHVHELVHELVAARRRAVGVAVDLLFHDARVNEHAAQRGRREVLLQKGGPVK
eukprot:scaffold1734_cov113-Isochrysis_galbana.AAC.21